MAAKHPRRGFSFAGKFVSLRDLRAISVISVFSSVSPARLRFSALLLLTCVATAFAVDEWPRQRLFNHLPTAWRSIRFAYRTATLHASH